MQQHQKGLLIALAGAVALSPDTMMIRLIGADVSSMLFWRGALLFLVLFTFLSWRMGVVQLLRLCRATGWLGVASGAINAVATACFVYGAQTTNAANLLIIVATAPMWAAVFSLVILREPVSRATVLAMLGCLLGIIIVFYQGVAFQAGIRGELAGLAAAMGLGLNLTIIRKNKQYNMLPVNAIGGLLLALACLPWAQPFALSSEQFSLVILLNVIILPLSFALLFTAPRYLHSAEVGLFILLETILGPLWVWLALSEAPTLSAYIGGAVVIATLVAHSTWRLRTDQ